MILIADSGSTKTHWALMTANGHASDLFTAGINPVHQSEELIRRTLDTELLPKIGPLMWAGTITHIFFYGAGCTPAKIPVMEALLQSVFKTAKAAVASDMVGAARALWGHESGVACILGTGSGSCWYNGEMEFLVPSLGYILGDEGSGAVLGKRLINALYKRPAWADLKAAFEAQVGIDMAGVIEAVYRQPNPNRTLAAWSRFCADRLDDPRISELLEAHFEDFVSLHLEPYYKDGRERTFRCVGGIAKQYETILSAVTARHNIHLELVLQDPIEGLKKYHRNDVTPTT